MRRENRSIAESIDSFLLFKPSTLGPLPRTPDYNSYETQISGIPRIFRRTTSGWGQEYISSLQIGGADDEDDAAEPSLKIGTSLKFDCSKDPDVVRAAEILMELSSGAEFSIFSDEMHPFPQPEVVRLKMRGMPEICVS